MLLMLLLEANPAVSRIPGKVLLAAAMYVVPRCLLTGMATAEDVQLFQDSLAVPPFFAHFSSVHKKQGERVPLVLCLRNILPW